MKKFCGTFRDQALQFAVVAFAIVLFSHGDHSPLSVRPAIADGGGSDANEQLEAKFEKKRSARKRSQPRRRTTKRSTKRKASPRGRSATTVKRRRSSKSNRTFAAKHKRTSSRETRYEKNARVTKKRAALAQNKEDIARSELQNETGGKPARTAINDLKTRIWEARRRYDEIEEQLQKVERNERGLRAQKKKIDDKSVFGLSDAAAEGAEKLGEQVPVRHLHKKATERALEQATTEAAKRELAKKGVKSIGGKLVGWAGWAGDILEYGGKKYIKRGVSGTLQEYITANSITASQLIQLQIKLRDIINRDNESIDRIRQKKIAYDKAFDWSAMSEKRAKEAADKLKPATTNADKRRVLDRAGDKDEQRLVDEKLRQDAKKSARIEAAPPRKKAKKPKKNTRQTNRKKRANRYHDSHYKKRTKRRQSSRRKSTRARSQTRKAPSSGVSIGLSVGGVSVSF